MKPTSFQYYPSRVNTHTPSGEITLAQFINSTKNPKDNIKEIFRLIAEAEMLGDKKRKAELKQNNLFYFTPCVCVHPFRRYEHIKRFTGLLVLDFDHLDNASDLKEYLFNEYHSIIAVWVSPSRKGVKTLVQIPIVQSVDEFKEYYFGIAAEMEQYAGFDPSGQNCVLPLFQSYDPDLLYRGTPDKWEVKGYKRSDFSTAPIQSVTNITFTDRDKQTISKMIDTGFANIIDLGHPPLRSLCLSLGGYIAAGYIDEWEVLDVINRKIESHPYLSKGVAGYQKTAKWAINAGQNKPLVLNYQKNG